MESQNICFLFDLDSDGIKIHALLLFIALSYNAQSSEADP